jgi:hypothetical protein
VEVAEGNFSAVPAAWRRKKARWFAMSPAGGQKAFPSECLPRAIISGKQSKYSQNSVLEK